MPSRELPPPPPPAHLREWLDEGVVRADRARFLADLSRRSLGPGRLLSLWGVAAAFALGWTFVGLAVMSFASGGPLEYLVGAVHSVIALGVLVPAGLCFARGARRERQVRQLLCAWVVAGRDPETDARLRAPARSLVWLVASLVLGASGLWMAFASAAGARPGTDTYGEVAYFMGFGMILWITALLGLAKTATHYRWALRTTHPGPPDAPRPTPSGAAAQSGPVRRKSSLAGV
ncbi:hypothetical protein [Streptomyces sp. NBC_00091]|uniref:hypothetical protein n=1 Tax=Streptomyces sp. NBC_00091 TaxID=2975648 RepID=UPI0022575360|nr:hypothetical protein [Streptomyces sp. NBC_00091]MCX5376456.1 hypothetical protein [Streptomyces sp. NBC_00091]